MKSIVLLALFALAANAFNITAFGIGEAQQYGIPADQVQQDGVPCFNALQTTFDSIIDLIETKDMITILSGFSGLYDQLQTDVETTCHAYQLDFDAWFIKNTPNTTNVVDTMKHNFGLYFAEVIQQIGFEIRDIINGDYIEAGAAKGLSAQILFGMITPQTPAVPAFNMSQYVTFDQEKFSSEYFTALFSAIGSSQVIIGSEVNACIGQLITFTENIESLVGNFSNYTFADKVGGISNLLEVSGETVQSCEYYAEIFTTLFAPLFEAFEANPMSVTLQVASNIALNAPELLQSAQQEEVYILEGDYTSAGEEKGMRFNQIFGFVGL